MILGQKVSVSVDKNSTSRYPKLEDFVFPLKIGFVNQPGEIDNNKEVYLLGFNNDYEKIEVFDGIVTAAAFSGERKKYVVSPPDMIFYTPEIKKSVDFFDTGGYRYQIRSLYQKSCGAILYTRKKSQILFLIVQNKNAHNGFPKGHIEYNETEIETAVREIYEETGLDVIIDSSFKAEYEYTVDGEIKKKGVYFLASFNAEAKMKINKNEISAHWLVPFKEAVKLLNYENDIKILNDAYERIAVKYYL